jgi:hypothetical protein
MPKKERAAKSAAIAMSKELESEMTDEERARKEKAGMGLFGGINKGEEELFAKKETKEEKKAKAEAKRAEMAAKKAAKKAAGEPESGDSETAEGSESGMSRTDSALDVSDLAIDAESSARVPLVGVKNKKGKGGKKEEEEVLETADSGGGLQKLEEGTLKFAVCTGVLASVRLGRGPPFGRRTQRGCGWPAWAVRRACDRGPLCHLPFLPPPFVAPPFVAPALSTSSETTRVPVARAASPYAAVVCAAQGLEGRQGAVVLDLPLWQAAL